MGRLFCLRPIPPRDPINPQRMAQPIQPITLRHGESLIPNQLSNQRQYQIRGRILPLKRLVAPIQFADFIVFQFSG
jgi:hypothetical protein